jgi:hypothetical protein
MDRRQANDLLQILTQIDPSMHDSVVVIRSGNGWAVGVFAREFEVDDFFYMPVDLDTESTELITQNDCRKNLVRMPSLLNLSSNEQILITQLGKNASRDSSLTSRLKIRAAHCRKRKQIA